LTGRPHGVRCVVENDGGNAVFDVRHVSSVRDASDAALACLATCLYNNPSWLRFQEIERAGVSSSYFLAHARDGTVVAALPVYRVTAESNPNYQLRRVFPPAMAGDGPHVLIGNRHGYHNALLTHPGLAPGDRQAALAQLVEAVLEFVRRNGIRTAWWPFLDLAGMRALRPLLGDPVPVVMKNECALRLSGTGFGDYLDQLSAKRRAAVRGERARFATAGYDIRDRRLSESVPDVARLGVETVRKHGGALDVGTARRMTSAQAELLDDTSIVLTCTCEDTPVGIALIMDHGDTTYLRAAGFDYARTGSAAEYFELVFYRPIERAYSLGLTGVSLGVSSYLAKASRGALLRTRWALPLVVPAWPDAEARRHNAVRLRAYEQELGTLRRAIPYVDYDEFC
jgi:uncharacterized protein